MSRTSNRITVSLMALTIGAGALAAAPAFAHNDRGGQAGHRAQNPFPPTQQRAPQGDTIGTGATLVPGGGQNSGDDNFNPRGDGGQGGTPFGIRRGRSFQVNCEFVTSGVFDPILSPGTNPFGHNHQFFGAESINAGSTTASLVAANTTRNSTSCLQSRDGSAYWVPALMADPTADSAGTAIEPDETRIWYSAPRGQRVRAFPAGFTLIAGDKSATTLQENAGWRCEDDPPRMPLEATPPDCDVDEGIVGVVRFPNCWDGKTVSSPTQAHVAYRTGRTCPTTHRYPVPELTMEVFWAGDGEAHTYGLSSGDTAGLHADFMNGWERRALRNNVRRWLNGR
ncbi:MAG: DUF1996 domain-containing protein [Thermoleophilia bacterium]|nr:DUF1996 domain-containing protein [Thermoleophilia bacterium]